MRNIDCTYKVVYGGGELYVVRSASKQQPIDGGGETADN